MNNAPYLVTATVAPAWTSWWTSAPPCTANVTAIARLEASKTWQPARADGLVPPMTSATRALPEGPVSLATLGML